MFIVAENYATSLHGQDGVAIIDGKQAGQPRLDQIYNAEGKLSDSTGEESP